MNNSNRFSRSNVINLLFFGSNRSYGNANVRLSGSSRAHKLHPLGLQNVFKESFSTLSLGVEQSEPKKTSSCSLMTESCEGLKIPAFASNLKV